MAANVEAYYRALATSENSWNVRDRHMATTLDRLREHHGGGRAVVWAHNTPVGDARATDMPRSDRLNLGQVVREAGDDVAIVGFGTHRGDVIVVHVDETSALHPVDRHPDRERVPDLYPHGV